MIKDLRKKIVVGVVGGSDLVKQKEQLGDDGTDLAASPILFALAINCAEFSLMLFDFFIERWALIVSS